MKKISLYFISKCKENSSEEEFNKNICTIVSNKKQIQEYILNRTIKDHEPHYSQWLLNHKIKDNDYSKGLYIDLLLNDNDSSLNDFCVRKEIYNVDGIAAMFRIFNKCEPVSSSYETAAEKNYYSWFVQELVKALNESYAEQLAKK